jgi:hypothetical protein
MQLVEKQPSSDRLTQMKAHGRRVRGPRPEIGQEAVLRCRVDGFSASDWRKFLLKAHAVPAELLEKCPWGQFNGFDWSELLFERKELGQYCPWKTFDEDDWRIILFSHPECRNEFDIHSGLKYEGLHVEDPGPIAWL